MRDPKRIERICSLIKELWEKCPDMRLGQLMENFVFSKIQRLGEPPIVLLWGQEDDETEKMLEKALKRLRRENEVK